MKQREFLTNLCENNKEAIIVSSLGTISYDLKEIDHPNKIIVSGAMGCVMGLGLGISLNTDKEVIVVIGDGSFLMKMGTIATILRYNKGNLRVVILNNGSYKSCGGQSTSFNTLIENVNIPFETLSV